MATGAWMVTNDPVEPDGTADRICAGGSTLREGSCAFSGGIQLVAGALLGVVGTVVALDDDESLGWLDVTLRSSPQLTLLHGPFSGDSGPWLNAGAAFEVGASGALHLHVEPTLVLGRVSRTVEAHVGTISGGLREVTVDESTTYFGTLTRVQAGAGFGRAVVRAGPAVGYAFGRFESNQCAKRAYDQPLFGASATGAYRFGPERELEVGLVVDAVATEYPQCRSHDEGPDPLTTPTVLRTEHAENVGLFAGLTLGYVL
jgi:hypothetical protein